MGGHCLEEEPQDEGLPEAGAGLCTLLGVWTEGSGFISGPVFWLLVKSPQLAAQPSTYLAVAEELEGVSGKYFDGLKEKAPAPEAEDEEVAQRLWAESAHLVGLDVAPEPPHTGTVLPQITSGTGLKAPSFSSVERQDQGC